jgi:hypothetical protein
MMFIENAFNYKRWDKNMFLVNKSNITREILIYILFRTTENDKVHWRDSRKLKMMKRDKV